MSENVREGFLLLSNAAAATDVANKVNEYTNLTYLMKQLEFYTFNLYNVLHIIFPIHNQMLRINKIKIN